MSHVLVVDDNEMVRYVLKRYLNGAGHEVSSAANGVEAMTLCEQASIDVLITDQHMPLMTGDVLISRVRALHPRLRCILLSAVPVERRLVQPDVTCLSKPLSKQALFDAVGAAG